MLHLFEYPWTFSYKPRIVYKQQQTERDWLLDYKTIAVIKDVETFWGVYNNIPSLTDMPAGSIYAMFKNGINPSWEDPENKTGFSWILYGSKNATKAWIHKIYESILLTLIGCQYKYEEYLNGCSFERKAKGDKFVFWFKSYPKNKFQGNENDDENDDENETKNEKEKNDENDDENETKNENGKNDENDDENGKNGKNDENEMLNELLNELLKEIGVNPEDYVLGDDEMKIDWKSSEYKHKKVCIKLVQHSVNTATKTLIKPQFNSPNKSFIKPTRNLTPNSQTNSQTNSQRNSTSNYQPKTYYSRINRGQNREQNKEIKNK